MQLVKKWIVLTAFFLFGIVPAFAQGQSLVVGAGYAFRSFDNTAGGTSLRMNFNGFDVNAAFNLNNWLGVAGDATGTYNNSNVNGNNQIYTFMAGPRVYPLGHHRIAPYVQAEFGGSHYAIQVPASGGASAFALAQRGFAWAAGGGVDIFVGRHLGFKGQAEYEETRFFQNPVDFPGAGLQNNFVLVVGPVIRF